MTPAEAEAFIRAYTRPACAPLVPEFELYLASEITPIWQATEEFLVAHNIAPPFWAFAWPGSQVLARYMLDKPASVQGRRVLDFAAGCGLAALAARRAGASAATVAEIDPLAIAACQLNAAHNHLRLESYLGDITQQPRQWDMIICGDVCYEAPMTRHILPWLRRMAADGADVWVADPGRAYLPKDGMAELASFAVETSLELEDRLVRRTKIYRLQAA